MLLVPIALERLVDPGFLKLSKLRREPYRKIEHLQSPSRTCLQHNTVTIAVVFSCVPGCRLCGRGSNRSSGGWGQCSWGAGCGRSGARGCNRSVLAQECAAVALIANLGRPLLPAHRLPPIICSQQSKLSNPFLTTPELYLGLQTLKLLGDSNSEHATHDEHPPPRWLKGNSIAEGQIDDT